MLTAQDGDASAGAALVERAIARNGAVADYHANLGLMRASLGQAGAAQVAWRLALALDPDQAPAKAQLARSAAVGPDAAATARAATLAGAAGSALRAGRPADAAGGFRAALAANPTSARLFTNLGVALAAAGRTAEATAAHRAALALQPGFAAAWFNLGLAWQALGRSADARAAYAQALVCDPGLAPAHANLASLHLAGGDARAAADSARAALASQPDLPEAVLTLGNALKAQGRPAEAEHAYRRALSLKPGWPQALANLAQVLRDQDALAEAITMAEAALDAGVPEPASVLASLSHWRKLLARWPGRAEVSARVLAAAAAPAAVVHPFSLLAEGADGPAQRRAAERYVAARYAGWPSLCPPGAPVRARDGPVRLGYLSADFQEHATATLIADLIECHDRRTVTVFGYSYGADDGGPLRARLGRGFDRFVDLHGAGAPEAAQRIHDDGVDILVELKGHTQGARLEIAAQRPAPVQVHYLGYPATTGAPFIDYFLADAVTVPPAHHAHFSETLVRLPDSYQCNDRHRPIGPSPSRTDAGLPETGPVLCCFNSLYKLTPALFTLWMRLLRAVPAAVLWLLDAGPEAAANLRAEAAARGIASHRLVFAPRLDTAAHLARHALADLFLDTLPVNAHTTASDALWAGLPVLTCPGDSFVARVGASLVRAAGVPDLACPDLAAYERIALDLLRDPPALAALRAGLIAARPHSPLFDTPRFARNLESAFGAIWQRHANGVRP